MDYPDDQRLYDSAGRRRAGLPASLPEHAREMLEKRILTGEIPPGHRVTEEELASTIGVSRTPVREALLKLEAQGLIVRRRGRGVYVANLIHFDEAWVLYRIRAVVEPHLAALAAERSGEELLETLNLLQRQYRDAISADAGELDLGAIIRIDSDMHWTIYHHAESDQVSIVAQYWGRIQRELYTRVYHTDYPNLLSSQHDDIIHALGQNDPKTASAATEEHIWSGWRAFRDSFANETS